MAKLISSPASVLTYFYSVRAVHVLVQRRAHRARLAVLAADEQLRVALATMYFCKLRARRSSLFWKTARTNPVILYVVSILVLSGCGSSASTSSCRPRPRLLSVHRGASTCRRMHRHDDHHRQLRVVLPPVPGFIKLMPSLSIVEVKETLPRR
jgi:hypothetical protein